MQHSEFKFQELFIPEISPNHSYPFNVNFIRKYKDLISGPAIYVLTLNDQIAYLGRYRTENDIINDRWSKHVQTNTCRGVNVGFGNSITLDRFQESYGMFFSINQIEFDEKELIENRFRDTGVVTARNKVKFCMQRWEAFQNLDESLNLSFHLFKPNPEMKENFVSELEGIEKDLIQRINPPANSQHNELYKTISLNDAISLIANLNY